MRSVAFVAYVASMASLALSGGCGSSDDQVECGVKAVPYTFCSSGDTKSYTCLAGSEQDAKTNEDIDAACLALGGTDTQAIAMCQMQAAQEGRYKMGPAQLAEDCAASDKVCDWAETGTCVERKQ